MARCFYRGLNQRVSMTELDIYRLGKPLGLSSSHLRKLLSYRVDSYANLQRGFIRAGLEPSHPVRLALTDNPSVMYEVYQKFLDSCRWKLTAVRQGHGQRLSAAKAQAEAQLFDPSSVSVTGKYRVIEPEGFDQNELFESVQPGCIRTLSGQLFPEDNFQSLLSDQTALGFTCERCRTPVHTIAEPGDYRRVTLCRCVGAIAAPPYTPGKLSAREWALIVHNHLKRTQESTEDNLLNSGQ